VFSRLGSLRLDSSRFHGNRGSIFDVLAAFPLDSQGLADGLQAQLVSQFGGHPQSGSHGLFLKSRP